MPGKSLDFTERQSSIALQQGQPVPPTKRPLDMIFLSAGTLLLLGAIVNYVLSATGGIAESSTLATILILVAVLLYLVPALASPTLRYLIAIDPASDIKSYIAKLRQEAPRIALACECYHMETRTRIVQRPVTRSVTVSSNDGERTEQVTEMVGETETYEERVVTHADQEPFAYARFVDTSPPLSDALDRYRAIRIDCTARVAFGDKAAEDSYAAFKQAFVARNRGRDVQFDLHEQFATPGLPLKFLSVVDMDTRPLLMHHFWYAASIATGTALLYGWWFRRVTAFGKIEFVKSVFVD